jgi:hypothetical protein
MSLEPDGYVVRVIDSPRPAPPASAVESSLESSMVPAIPPSVAAPPPAPRFASSPIPPAHDYGIGRQELFSFPGIDIGPDQRSLEVALRFGDVIGRLDTLLIGSTATGDGVKGGALVSAWRGWPITVAGHLFKSDDDRGLELRGSWSRRFPRSSVALDGGALSADDDRLFGGAALATFQQLGRLRVAESARIDVDDDHQRAVAAASFRRGSIHVAARYQRDRGDAVALGGLASSILPRSAYALTVLDPALPVAILSGRRYDGWRVETTLPSLPITGFYQRHEIDGRRLSLVGANLEMHLDPNPILKLPALDVTLGAAYAMDAAVETIEGKTRWWLGMRWRP